MKVNRKIFLSIFLSMFGVLLFSSSTFAYTAVEQKALGYGVFRCYNQAREGNNDTVHAVVGEIKLKDVTSYEDIILSNSKDYVPLPTGFSSLHKVTDDNNISCRDLIGGCGDSCFVGLLKKAGVNEHPNNDGEREKLLTILGYTPATSASGRCFKLKNYSMSLGGERISHETVGVCSSSGKSNATDVYIHGSGNDSLDKIEISGDILTMSLWVRNTKADGITGYQRTVYDTKTYNLNNFASFDALSNAMVNDFTDHYVKKPGELYCPITSGTISTTGGDFKQICADGATAREWYDSNNSAKGGIYTIASTRTSDKRALASYKAANNLLGSSFNKVKDIAFTPKEEYDLYKTYFDNYYAASLQCDYGNGQSATESSLQNDNYQKINGGSLSGCYAKPTKNANSSVYGLNNDKYFDGTELSFKELIEAYSKSAQAASISKKDIESGASNAEVNNTDEGSPCYNADVEGMSWILCPALDNTTSAVDAIEQLLRDWLQIDPNNTVNKDQTRDAWNIFRNIANIIMIIIFLVVIFSQLTGMGIDNYGIKKILPRLVVMAVLINLSYIICELAVDLSNILGVGLDNMFKNIGYSINPNGGANLTAQAIVAVILALISAGGVVAGIAINSGGGVMIIISLLLALVVALVAVLMFFVMLSARMIIVILFTIISPVAFALYVLPNTQNLFKKWWKVFQAALVVYPICGALYGMSVVIKAIVINGDGSSIDFIPGLIAVVAPFLPFLLLPTLLKNALAGLGALGGTLTMLGNGLRKGVSSGKSAIENTKAYKGAQERAADRSAERRATRIRNRLQRANIRNGGTADNLSGLNASQRRRLFQAQTTLNERTQQRAQDSAGAFTLDSGVAESRAMSRRRSQEFKNYADQYSSLTRGAMDTELQSAVAAYRTDKSEQNAIRLQAAIATADERKMNRELLNALGQSGANGLSLRGNDENDQFILNQMASSNNKVVNQFAKARAKNSGTAMSLHDFMNGAEQGDNLADVFNSKGPEVMNGMDDDTLSYINGSNRSADINTGTIFNAAMQTSDAKELAQLNAMLGGRSDYTMKTSDFANIKPDTLRSLDPKVYAAALIELQNGSESSRQIIGKMDQAVRNELRNTLRAHPTLDLGGGGI